MGQCQNKKIISKWHFTYPHKFGTYLMSIKVGRSRVDCECLKFSNVNSQVHHFPKGWWRSGDSNAKKTQFHVMIFSSEPLSHFTISFPLSVMYFSIHKAQKQCHDRIWRVCNAVTMIILKSSDTRLLQLVLLGFWNMSINHIPNRSQWFGNWT